MLFLSCNGTISGKYCNQLFWGRTRVAAVHQADHMDAVGASLDENVVQIVVADHPVRLEVAGHQRLVVAIGLVVVVVAQLRPVPRIVEEDGVVFLALQERLDRRVALKVMRPDSALFDESHARFRREVEAVARLSHPAIPSRRQRASARRASL